MAEKKQQQGPPSTSINTFLKGMNKDVAKYVLPPDTYYDGSNIRIAPHHSKEGAAVVNVEGNEFLAEIPCAPKVLALEMKDQVVLGAYWEGTLWNVICNIYTDGATYSRSFTATGGNIVSVIYQALISDFPGFTTNGVLIGNGSLPDNINFAYDNSRFRLTFWSEDENDIQITNVIVSNNYTNTINIGGKDCDLEIIGYTTIRDDIYLFTTSHDGGTPEAIGGSGQIWRLRYDPSTYEVNWKCVYNNNLVNFTKQHPIQAIGRYENKDEQGVYWTDNFNPPRKLNVAAEDSIAIDARFLDLAPVTEFQIPTLHEITIGGTLPAGTYQIAYRYKSFEGLTSNWSPLSNKVSLYGDEETDPFCNIEGGEIDLDTADLMGTLTSKRIEWQLKDLDTTYDLIEFGAVYMKTSGYDPLLHQYYMFKVAPNILEDISVELTGSEQKIQLSPTEFQEGIGATFERVKTIASRDNKLFMGNITNTSFFVDFDSRVYRFDHKLNQCRLDSESDVTVFIDGNNLYTEQPGTQFTTIDKIPETHDCINPYNDENPETNADWYSDDQYMWQSNGVIIGGTGPNISYKFITQPLKGDDAQLTNTQFSNFIGDVSGYNGNWTFIQDWFLDVNNCNWYQPPPLDSCLVNPNETSSVTEFLGVPGQTYDQQGTIENFKSSYQYSLFEGYARGETYRFGIVFYNSKGSPSFVNWIGDIKFPCGYHHDINEQIGQFSVHKWKGFGQDLPWMDYDGDFQFRGEMWLQSLGIEFTVDLSEIDTKELGITGYSIVRCERKETDKSRLGHGLAWQVDRVRMRSDGRSIFDSSPSGFPGYDFLTPHYNQIVGTNNGCSVYGLFSCDPGQDNMNDNIYAGNSDPGAECWHVKLIQQKALLLYGPLNWVNSETQQLYNRDYKVDFIGGDYIKIESAFCPLVNGAYASLPQWNPGGNSGGFAQNNQPTGQWYKYYYPISMTVGSGWNDNVGYYNGLPFGASQDPANLKFPLEYASWVGDGQTLPKESDVAMPYAFVNVCNLGEPVFSIGPSDNGCGMCQRPRSIGSECMFTLTKDPLNFRDMLMGSHDSYFVGGTEYTPQTIARTVMSYERYVRPYGGPTYAERSRSIYIMANHYYPISSVMQQIPTMLQNMTSKVFGGDVSVNIFDYTQQEKNWGQFPEFPGKWGLAGPPYNLGCATDLTDDSLYGIMRGCVVPLEVHTSNPEFRKGYHFASKGGANNPYPDDGTFLHDEYRILDGYMAVTNVRTYIPQPLDFNINEEFDTRIYYSNTKTNGESSDSWAVFKVGNFHDVEGIQGPLNNLLVHQDKMYFFQDKGFGVLNINPNAIVQSADGQSIQLGTVSSGTGAFIQSYQYISNQFGASQQWAVTKSQSSIYFFDAIQKKLFRFDAQGMNPLTDIFGLSSWFQDKLIGDVIKFDNPIIRRGVTSTFDNKHNEALFTFHDKNVNQLYQTQIVAFTPLIFEAGIVMVLRAIDECNDCFHMKCPEPVVDHPPPTPTDPNVPLYDNEITAVSQENGWATPELWLNGQLLGPVTILGFIGCPGFPVVAPLQYGDMVVMLPWFEITDYDTDVTQNPVIEMECPIGSASYTIAYNEFAQGFTSFYDFHPSIYVNDGKIIVTPNTENLCYNNMNYWNQEYLKDNLYIHDIGSYGTFYDVTMASRLSLISNEASVMTKSFDNVSFHMESIQVDGEPQSEDFDVQFDVFDMIRFSTDYQTTGWIETNTGDYYGDRNIRKVEREWQMPVGRNVMSAAPTNMDIYNPANYDLDRQFKDRLRDKYMIIDLKYDNLDNVTGVAKNVKFILHYFRTFFRGSFR